MIASSNGGEMRHFLQYWKNYNPEYELGTPLNFAASAQFKKLKKGDLLWDRSSPGAQADAAGKARGRQHRPPKESSRAVGR
jgi:hypothetical protein